MVANPIRGAVEMVFHLVGGGLEEPCSHRTRGVSSQASSGVKPGGFFPVDADRSRGEPELGLRNFLQLSS